MRCINKEFKVKIAGLAISLLFVVLILTIFTLPSSTAIDVRLESGILTLENTTVYEGSLVNFTDISFSISYEDVESIDHLNFSIFDNETNQHVNYVNFDADGVIIQQNSSGNFSILDATETGGEEVVHPAHGYAPATVTYTDLNYSYDISFKTTKLGTFYAKLILVSDEETFTSNKSETFTVTAPDEFLFDVDLDLTLPEVYTGENNTALIDLMNVGGEGLVNATIERIIYYGDIIIWSNITEITVSGKKFLSSSIPTDGFEPGEYRYEVIHRYGDNQFASASKTFIVKEKEQEKIEPKGEIPYMLLISIAIIILIIAIIAILYLKGILFLVKDSNVKYLIIYKHDDIEKYNQIQEVLFGQQNSVPPDQVTGLLKEVQYELLKEGVLLFDEEKDMDIIAQALEQLHAQYSAGTYMISEKNQDFDEDADGNEESINQS